MPSDRKAFLENILAQAMNDQGIEGGGWDPDYPRVIAIADALRAWLAIEDAHTVDGHEMDTTEVHAVKSPKPSASMSDDDIREELDWMRTYGEPLDLQVNELIAVFDELLGLRAALREQIDAES